MINLALLSFLGSVLENIVLFLIGRTLIYSKLLVEYLGWRKKVESEDSSPTPEANRIESILKLTGQIIQVIALLRILTDLVSTIVVLDSLKPQQHTTGVL